MHIRNSKGLKPKLVKYTAVLIGVCYLLNPIQQQIFDVVHVISHTLELPDNILSHEIDHGETLRIHKSINHHADVINHEHELIDLVKTIFKASNEDHQTPNENIAQVKCDKHLVTHKLILIGNPVILEVDNYPLYYKELEKGYLSKSEEPPQKYPC